MIEDKLKRLVVNVTEKSHAELVISLKQDDFVNQSDFFRTIINCYINKDPLFLDFIDSIKVKRSARNKAHLNTVKTWEKKVRTAVASKDAKAAFLK